MPGEIYNIPKLYVLDRINECAEVLSRYGGQNLIARPLIQNRFE